MRILVTGATGFIGARLVRRLLADGHDVRALVRDRRRAAELEAAGAELFEADLTRRDELRGAGERIDVAYYLVHAMGRGGRGDFESRERQAAVNFAGMAWRDGVRQVIYLGGLGDHAGSKHLRSRHATAVLLAEHGPPLTYFRAGMVVGPESESYRTLRHLVARLPVMLCPSWLRAPTQPIAVDDVIEYLAQAAGKDAVVGREVQIGSPDVLSYAQMLDRMAEALGKRPRPKLPVPVLSPRLSALWIGLVTPVDTGIARPLIEGLATATTVTDSAAASLFDIAPASFRDALARAVAEEGHARIARGQRSASSESAPAARAAPRSPAGARRAG